MGVRMSRTPGGGSTKSMKCKHGESGERGNGSRYGGKTLGNSGWNPEKSKTRMGKQVDWPTAPRRYGDTNG